MIRKPSRRWVGFWACVGGALLAIQLASGVTLLPLLAYISYSLLNNAGAPLADGSYVMIIGSTDANNNGMAPGYAGSLQADSVRGDDVFLGIVRIDMPSYYPDGMNPSNGTFFTDSEIWFDYDIVKYMYIRFFDSTNYPIVGTNIYYGTSTVVKLTNEAGLVKVDFTGNYLTSIRTNFTVIPEPGTGHLLLMVLGLLAGLHLATRKDRPIRKA